MTLIKSTRRIRKQFTKGIPIRIRLTLWYVLLLGLILAIFSGALYLILDGALDAQVDAHLRSAAEQVLGAVKVDGGQLHVQQTEGESEITPLGEQGLLVRVVGLDGKTVDTTGPYRNLPLPGNVLADLHDGETRFVNADAPPSSTPLRLFATPVVDGGRVYGAVVVGQSLEPTQDALGQLLLVLAIVVPITLACTSAGGLFLANRALQPIEHITKAAQRISAQDLSQRLNLDLPQDEVGRLATTFDAMLARLDDAFQRQRQFTADASHELRTPLAIMKGNIGVALNRPRRPAEYQAVLNDLEDEVDGLTHLVEDLLLLARSDSGEPLLRTAPVDLAELLQMVIDQVRFAAENRHLTLALSISGTLCLKGDAGKLSRLFLNLLDNGIKYTPSGGQIAVRAAENGQGWIVVEVADTGPGIPPEQLNRIFERFYRVDEARTRSAGGSGLGLAIAHWIAEAHNGRIEARSTPGQGSTFSIWLPLTGGI